MVSFLDVCRFRAASTGVGDFVVSGPIQGYQTPLSAGANDGAVYRYRAETDDLMQWEVGYGTYTASSTTLSRATVLYNSSGDTSLIDFSTRPKVAVVALAMDIPQSTDMEITSGSFVNIDVDASIVRVNKTIGGATTLNMPAATDKICDVLICDWKQDAGTNNITINPSGSEKIQGLSSWVIAADGGSIFLRRIPGVGYAV